jgi:hypothetical protein
MIHTGGSMAKKGETRSETPWYLRVHERSVKWEYKSGLWYGSFPERGKRRTATPVEEFSKFLNDLGKDGWEIILLCEVGSASWGYTEPFTRAMCYTAKRIKR